MPTKLKSPPRRKRPPRSTEAKPGPLLFARKFLRDGTRVASFAPSSRVLAKAMIEHVDPHRPQVIIELGAGTGAVTEFAARKMHPESRLIAIEIDPQFAELLRRKCPRAEVVVGDAMHLDELLGEMGIEHIDVVLNGLPTPSLPQAVNAAVLKCVAHRARDGWYSQLTVMPWVYLKMYRKLFEFVDFRLVVRNVPPGGVYHCRNLRPHYDRCLPGKA